MHVLLQRLKPIKEFCASSLSAEHIFFCTQNMSSIYCIFHVVSRDFPVLIQGETSVGKTSLISWLAKASGNYCVRINNHEHTDIQEYLGCYTSDNNGKLIFKEGIAQFKHLLMF